MAQSLLLWLWDLLAIMAQKAISPWPLSSKAKILSSWKYPTHPHTPAHRLHWADPGNLQGSWQMAPCGLIRKSYKKILPPLPFARNWDCLDFNHCHSEKPTWGPSSQKINFPLSTFNSSSKIDPYQDKRGASLFSHVIFFLLNNVTEIKYSGTWRPSHTGSHWRERLHSSISHI